MRRVFVVGLILFVVGAACAAEQSAISLQLKEVDIEEALATLSQQAQAAILGDATVKGKVSCNLGGITIEQALDVICGMNKLEWSKVYASAGIDERPSATKLFKLLDSLKELGGSTVICEDSKTESHTIFAPSAKAGSLDVTSVITGLNLKPVYLIRANPDLAAAEREKEEAQAVQRAAGSLLAMPLADPRAAAGQVWNYFGQMPVQQQFQVMHELRSMMFQNLTPEQLENMRGMFGGGRRDREGGWHPQGQPSAP